MIIDELRSRVRDVWDPPWGQPIDSPFKINVISVGNILSNFTSIEVGPAIFNIYKYEWIFID